MLCVCSVTLPSGATRLASGGFDGTLRLWDAEGDEAVAVLRGHAGAVESVCGVVLPGGAVRLATAGGDGTVRIWHAEGEGGAVAVLRGHAGGVWCVSSVVLPGGAVQLCSGGADGTVRMWDAEAAKGRMIRCCVCGDMLDDEDGASVKAAVGCDRSGCDRWACVSCAGFTSLARAAAEGQWFCDAHREGKRPLEDDDEDASSDGAKRQAVGDDDEADRTASPNSENGLSG